MEERKKWKISLMNESDFEKILSKNDLKKFGLITLIVYTIFAIPSIVMTGITYSFTNYDWSTIGIFRFTGTLNLICCILFSIELIFGVILYLVFINSLRYKIYYCVFQIMSNIYILSVSIFSIYASVIKYKKQRGEMIIRDIKGIYSNFYCLDPIFQKADEILCSDNCVCHFTSRKTYLNFLNHDNYSQYMNYSFDYGAKNIFDCPHYESYFIDVLKNKTILDVFGEIKISNFFKFWEKFENRFKCNSWMNRKNYYITDSNQTMIPLGKYISSDINKGFVNRIGCYAYMAKYISDCVTSLGVFFLVSSLLMFLNFFINILLSIRNRNIFYNIKDDKSNNIPNIFTDNYDSLDTSNAFFFKKNK